MLKGGLLLYTYTSPRYGVLCSGLVEVKKTLIVSDSNLEKYLTLAQPRLASKIRSRGHHFPIIGNK